MRILVDTNVLLRCARLSDPLSRTSRNTLKQLRRNGIELCLVSQTIREMWGVSTRPAEANGLGFPIPVVERLVNRLERSFLHLPDAPAAYEIWRRLVRAHDVKGRQVHDAHLAASMLVHGVRRILTFDTADFARYRDIEAIDPRRV